MALTKTQIGKIRSELDESVRPFFIFHDDPDGLCSFLLLYRVKKEGMGIPVKSTPKVDMKFVRRVREFCPDKVFIVDMAIVEQDFIDAVKHPVIWVDHHEPLERYNVKYFNPRLQDKKDNQPASYLCYQVVDRDMWIAAVGCIGDWFFLPFASEFRKKYPGLLPEGIKRPEDALFNSRLGELVMMFSFMLKGKTTDVSRCIKTLTRIESPYEILDGTSSRGRFIRKHAQRISEKYDLLRQRLLSQIDKEQDLLVFTYQDSMSFTKELSNEMIYRFPDKKIIIGRVRGDEIKCSLRSVKMEIPDALAKALVGVYGYGGGHEHACGACIKLDDFDKFISNYKEQIENYEKGHK